MKMIDDIFMRGDKGRFSKQTENDGDGKIKIGE